MKYLKIFRYSSSKGCTKVKFGILTLLLIFIIVHTYNSLFVGQRTNNEILNNILLHSDLNFKAKYFYTTIFCVVVSLQSCLLNCVCLQKVLSETCKSLSTVLYVKLLYISYLDYNKYITFIKQHFFLIPFLSIASSDLVLKHLKDF